MILKDNNGKEVELHAVMHDHDDIEIIEAYYVDTGIALSDDEIDELQDSNHSEIYQEAYENAVMAAEYHFEGDR
jgi:hypothetical protein